MSLAIFAAGAAADLAPGEKAVLSNGNGLSVTVKRSRDGKTIDIKGNNRKSREALNG